MRKPITLELHVGVDGLSQRAQACACRHADRKVQGHAWAMHAGDPAMHQTLASSHLTR